MLAQRAANNTFGLVLSGATDQNDEALKEPLVMSVTSPSAAASGRRYDLDWLRVIAFGFLIFYHIGMFFVPWGWHVKSDPVVEAIQYPMLLLNPWRLALLFFISGVAVRFLLDREGPLKFALDRSWRLLPVIIFGMAVVVMPQAYFQLRYEGAIEPGILSFWARYLMEVEIGGLTVPTWNHLWYVVYLFVYCLILALTLPVWRGLEEGPIGRIIGALWDQKLAPVFFLALPVLPFVLFRVTLDDAFPTTHNLTSDWANHAHRWTVFLYGFYAAKSDRFWGLVERVGSIAIVLAAAYAVALFWALAMPEAYWDDHPAVMWAMRVSRIGYAWWIIITLLFLAQRYLAGSGPVLRYLTAAIFPYYILHQTLIVAAGYWTNGLGMPLALQFAVIFLATVGGCALGYELVRRSGPFRLVFGLKIRPRRR